MSRCHLVTGGAGFVGASLVRALEERGDRVRVVDWFRAAGRGYLAGTEAELIEGDLSDLETASRAVAGVDSVVHLAARTSVPASIGAPLEDMRHNVVASVTLLDAARQAGVDRFVVASSNAALGAATPPLREDARPQPVVPYGAAKLAIEAYVAVYARSYGMTTAALRFSNGYGPYALHKRSVVASFIRSYLADEPLVVFGDGSQTRDFVHSDDLVQILLRTLDAPPERVAGQVFQAGTGVATSVRALAETLLEVGGRAGSIEYRPPRQGDVLHSFSDISRARDVLGYEPRVDLAEGLARTVRWFEQAQHEGALVEIAAGEPASGSD